MLRVIRPENVNLVKEPVKIPDAVIIKKPKMLQMNNAMDNAKIELDGVETEDVEKLEKYLADTKKEMLDEVNKEYEKISNESRELMETAQQEAATAIREAKETADKILNEARREGENIRKQAQEEGFIEGQKIKFEEITHVLDELEQTVEELKTKQQNQFNSFYGDLKYFAIDIAEKVVYKNIDRDDSYLEELVKEALKGVKDAEWITVQLSEKLSGLVAKLKVSQQGGEIGENVEFKLDDSDVGTVRIKTSDRVIDASIPAQLANIKKYFETYGDEENG